VVERLEAEHSVEVEWRPFYLYLDTPPEGRELPAHVKQRRASGSEERLRQIAESYGMEFQSVPRIYNTRLAHEATEYARGHGKGNEFHKVVFRKVYAEGEDPSQWDVLRAVAEEVGLDADEMQRKLKLKGSEHRFVVLTSVGGEQMMIVGERQSGEPGV